MTKNARHGSWKPGSPRDHGKFAGRTDVLTGTQPPLVGGGRKFGTKPAKTIAQQNRRDARRQATDAQLSAQKATDSLFGEIAPGRFTPRFNELS